MNMKKKVAIVGGGVSGLLSSLEFQKRGWNIDVFDPELLTGNTGFGFLLMPNGVSGLQKLGYWNSIKENTTSIQKIFTINDNQEILNEQKVENVYGISRLNFLKSLASHLNEDVTRFAEKITYSSESLRLSSGEKWDHSQYQWVLGCDGLHSQIRKMLFEDAEMLDAPTYEINGSFQDENFTSQHAGNLYKIIFDEMGIAFGILPLHTGQVIWYLQLSRKHYPISDGVSLPEFVQSTVSKYKHPWIDWIVKNHLKGLYLWRGKILLGVDQYIKDKYILLGDAAHVVLPFTSQGTNLAIDDISSLMHTLDHLESQEDIAIKHFNNRREICERIAFEGMEYAHLFSNNDSRFMITHMPLVFDQP